MKFDCFIFNNELDMLECRLTELAAHVDYFVLVESTVTHQNTPKPLHYQNNADRFYQWADQIIPVVADNLPDDPNPWSREHAQRERIRDGLEAAGVQPDDIIYQSDVDEIPRRDVVDILNPRRLTVLVQDFYSFAVNWRHPQLWTGTTVNRYGLIDSFAAMRDQATFARSDPPMSPCPLIPDAGWHFTWVGGPEFWPAKRAEFAHPELQVHDEGLGWYFENGVHVDGKRCVKVDHDDYPEYIRDGLAPESWWHR